MSCTSQCAKYFLCLFNFIFFIAGGASLAVGIWLIADQKSFVNLIAQIDETDLLNKTDAHVLEIISYILIIVGALTFFVSFLGYCGAMFESRCLLCVYGVLILIVLILECVVVGLAFELKGDARNEIEKLADNTLQSYTGNQDAPTILWDKVMTQFHCCGSNSYKSFDSLTKWNRQGKIIPEACCKRVGERLLDQNCPIHPSNENAYLQGCVNGLVQAVEDNAEIIIGVCAGLVVIEVLVIILALYLACCHWRPQHACVDVSSRHAW